MHLGCYAVYSQVEKGAPALQFMRYLVTQALEVATHSLEKLLMSQK